MSYNPVICVMHLQTLIDTVTPTFNLSEKSVCSLVWTNQCNFSLQAGNNVTRVPLMDPPKSHLFQSTAERNQVRA